MKPLVYTTGMLEKMLGISKGTILKWERYGLIPQARRIGLNYKRIWTPEQAEQIIEFKQSNYNRV